MPGGWTYADALEALSGALKFGIDPSLDAACALAEALGRPQDDLRCVQVTGTNGKSSVTWTTDALLRAHGRRCGAYTSPHLESYTERILIDGDPISEEGFARSLQAAAEAAERAGLRDVTEFELLTGAALHAFREAGVEWAVLEVGMGGRWDATSVVLPEVAVIVGVALDHTDRLGGTVAEIAEDKSCIVKAGSRTVVLGPETCDVREICVRHAREEGVEVHAVGDRDLARAYAAITAARRPWPLPHYQLPNVATALAAAEAALGEDVRPPEVAMALSEVVLPGRFELVAERPPVVLDGAHNPDAALSLAEAVHDSMPAKGPVVVLAILADKDAEGIVEALVPVASSFVVTRNASPRCLAPEELAGLVERLSGTAPLVEPDVAHALMAAARKAARTRTGVLVTGSLYTVGEARAALRDA